MPNICLIGAGSVVFARTLLGDILSYPELQGADLRLVDIDAERLALARDLASAMIERNGLAATVSASTDRKEALDGADYVLVMIQVGGLAPFELDIEIPQRYGVDQCVGDTLGPGGVFRGLRTIPVLLQICRDMRKLCPDALLINYSNPMAINCWAMNEASGVRNVGLCHSVQGTAMQLANRIGAPFDEVTYWVAGINHMSWFLEFRHRGEDAYPRLHAAMEDPAIYDQDRVRFEMMRHTGYFVTESSGHMSEYLPFFRKRGDLLERFMTPGFGGESGFYLRHCRGSWKPHFDRIRDEIDSGAELPLKRSHEYASTIIHAIETDSPARFNGNVVNAGLIANLPEGCCVEVPCLVDGTGIRPCAVGELPPHLASINRSNIAVQELAVRAALDGDPEAAFHAVLLDPLTSAMLAPHEIRAMVDEMFEAQREWLPQFG